MLRIALAERPLLDSVSNHPPDVAVAVPIGLEGNRAIIWRNIWGHIVVAIRHQLCWCARVRLHYGNRDVL